MGGLFIKEFYLESQGPPQNSTKYPHPHLGWSSKGSFPNQFITVGGETSEQFLMYPVQEGRED